MYKHIFFLLLLTLNVPFQIGKSMYMYPSLGTPGLSYSIRHIGHTRSPTSGVRRKLRALPLSIVTV